MLFDTLYTFLHISVCEILAPLITSENRATPPLAVSARKDQKEWLRGFRARASACFILLFSLDPCFGSSFPVLPVPLVGLLLMLSPLLLRIDMKPGASDSCLLHFRTACGEEVVDAGLAAGLRHFDSASFYDNEVVCL